MERAQRRLFNFSFYNSAEYATVEDQWPKKDRLTLYRTLIEIASTKLGVVDLKILDYGCGSKDIVEKKVITPHATFFDPFFQNNDLVRSIHRTRKFDVTICTEVLEHLASPKYVLRKIKHHTTHLLLATTLLNDLGFNIQYIAPEAGHISIFSRKSIEICARAAGFNYSLEWFDQQFYYHVLRPFHEEAVNRRC